MFPKDYVCMTKIRHWIDNIQWNWIWNVLNCRNIGCSNSPSTGREACDQSELYIQNYLQQQEEQGVLQQMAFSLHPSQTPEGPQINNVESVWDYMKKRKPVGQPKSTKEIWQVFQYVLNKRPAKHLRAHTLNLVIWTPKALWGEKKKYNIEIKHFWTVNDLYITLPMQGILFVLLFNLFRAESGLLTATWLFW